MRNVDEIGPNRANPSSLPPATKDLPSTLKENRRVSPRLSYSREFQSECRFDEPFLGPNPTWSSNHTTVGLRLHPHGGN